MTTHNDLAMTYNNLIADYGNMVEYLREATKHLDKIAVDILTALGWPDTDPTWLFNQQYDHGSGVAITPYFFASAGDTTTPTVGGVLALGIPDLQMSLSLFVTKRQNEWVCSVRENGGVEALLSSPEQRTKLFESLKEPLLRQVLMARPTLG